MKTSINNSFQFHARVMKARSLERYQAAQADMQILLILKTTKKIARGSVNDTIDEILGSSPKEVDENP